MFLYITTDGAITSTQSTSRNSPWIYDRGVAGVTYMLVFDPQGRPLTSDFQIGHFTQGQVADEAFMAGWNAESSAVAVFANYMKLCGKMSLMDTITGSKFSQADLDNKIIKFK